MKSSSNGLVIDGFVRKSHTRVQLSKKTEKSEQKATSSLRRQPAQKVHTKAQRARTLMRHGVHKPIVAKKAAPPTATRKNHVFMDTARSLRSQAIAKSPKIRRFSDTTSTVVDKAPAKSAHSNSAQPEVITRPAASTTSSKAVTKALPSMVTSVSHQQLERLLDQALLRADAHKKAREGKLGNQNLWQRIKRAPKLLTVAPAVLAVLLLGGFFAWQNIPQVSMRVAATKAHISAQVPDYVPSGFSFNGPIKTNDGGVSMQFKATSDPSRAFTITQKNSKMDSKSLSDSIPSKTSTGQVNGTTVIMYGPNSDATWVNHGIQYTVKDNANLNTDQILKIAGGL